MSLGKIESYLYSSGVAATRNGTATITITEAATPAVVFTLPATDGAGGVTRRFSEALTWFQTEFNAAGGLANTYAFTFDTATNRVTLARNVGVVTFTPTFGGDMAAFLGLTGTLSAGTSFTGASQPLGAFASIRVGVPVLQDGSRVDMQRYRFGRSESLCFGNHDILDVKVALYGTQARAFEGAYAAAGRIRLWQDQTVANAYSTSVPSGYHDGWVISATKPSTRGSAEEWVEYTIRLGVPRA